MSGLGFELTMPDIILDVLVEGVDIATVIEVDIGDFTDIKPDVKDVKFRDVGHIDVRLTYRRFLIPTDRLHNPQVEIIGLTPELDSFVSPITSLAVNMVKRDVQELVTPLLKEMLTEVVRSSAPSDLSVLFG